MQTKLLYAVFRKSGNTGNLEGVRVYCTASGTSSDNDGDRYVSIRNLLDSNFNMRQEPETPESVLIIRNVACSRHDVPSEMFHMALGKPIWCGIICDGELCY
jgi:hypothetical protein